MAEYKFDSFYYDLDDDIIYLDEIENLSDEELSSLYKNHAFCPVCKGVQLSFVHRNNMIFLRTYPHQKHKMDNNNNLCIYSFDEANSKVLTKHIDKLQKENKVQDLLSSALRKLYPKDINIQTQESQHTSDESMIISYKTHNVTQNKVIPHYSFRGFGKTVPCDHLAIFYGKVSIEVKEYKNKNNNKTYHRIHIYNLNTKNEITNFFKPFNLDIKNGNYYLSVLGYCEEKIGKYKSFYNLKLYKQSSEFICLKPLNDGL